MITAPTPPGGVGNYCPELSTTIIRGNRDSSTNSQVTYLQKFLSAYYDIPSEELVTGFFGRITQDYVIRFQKEQGLPSLGIVGSMTRASIAKACGGTASVNQSSNANQSVALNLPVGCTATTNFSSVTGQKCVASATANVNVNVNTNQSTSNSGIFTTSSSLFSNANATVSNQSATVNSIVSNSRTPVITGTATGVSQIGLSLGDAGGKVYGSGNGTISVINNRWSHTVSTPLTDGSYTIDVASTNSQKLASGSLTVRADGGVNPAVSATIDNNSGSSISPEGREGITIFGTATGISAVRLVIIGGLRETMYVNSEIPVVNGQYKKVMYNTELNLVPGRYVVYIQNEGTPLAEKVITIAGATTLSCSGSLAPSSQKVVSGVSGTAWGSGPFTTDSNLSTIAAFLGTPKGSSVFLNITDLGCISKFVGSTQNGVTANSYSSWRGMNVSASAPISTSVAPTTATLNTLSPNPVNPNSSFTFSWSGNNNPTSYYVKTNNIENSMGTATSWTGVPATTFALGYNSYLDFSVKACNSAGCSPYSAVQRLNTIAAN